MEEGGVLDRVLERGQLALVVHEFESLLRVDEVLIHCVERLDLVLGEEVSHHVVQEAHAGGLEVAAEGPEEREREEGAQRAQPNVLVWLLQYGEVLRDEVLEDAAHVYDQLNIDALESLVLRVELELGESLVNVQLKHVFELLDHSWAKERLNSLALFRGLSVLSLPVLFQDELVDPLRLVWAPAKLTGRHVDHTAPTDRRWAGSRQVLHLKEHAHLLPQFDSLAVCQT